MGPPSESGATTLWGPLTVRTKEITDKTALVGDYTHCQFFFRRGATVEVGYNNNDFSMGMRTIRVGARGVQVTFRPSAFVRPTALRA